MSDLITFYGKTDGTNTTGTFDLDSDWVYKPTGETLTEIKIDRSMAAKIVNIQISGKPVIIHIEVSEDGGTNWKPIKSLELASEGELEKEFKKPLIILAKNDQTMLRFTWEQSTAGVSYLNVNIEFGKIK